MYTGIINLKGLIIMKRHYVYGYGNEKKSVGERYTAVFLVGMAIAAALITFFVIGIAGRLNKAKNTDVLIESEEYAGISVVSDNNEHKDEFKDNKSETVSSYNAQIKENEKVPFLNTEEENVIADEVQRQSGDDEDFILPCNGEIIYDFSPIYPLYSKTLDDWRTHNGIDIHVPLGTEVLCIADGTVHSIYEDLKYGNTVVVVHSDDLRSVYSNLMADINLKEGETIKKGSVIARVGDTALFETVADTHLHFEMLKNSKYVNPCDYLRFK